jgi:hypothetical protein
MFVLSNFVYLLCWIVAKGYTLANSLQIYENNCEPSKYSWQKDDILRNFYVFAKRMRAFKLNLRVIKLILFLNDVLLWQNIKNRKHEFEINNW